MKITPFRYIPLLVLALTVLVQCDKDEVNSTAPLASFKLSPSSGLTTTTFQFDASASKATSAGDTLLFIRWDWDRDEIWDTGFSRSRLFTHRYYKPGSYNPRMEIRNEAGLSDTIELPVEVARGYSAPQPSFTISPASGNLRVEFVFDAGQTKDDEDSLNTLKFRWDWDGNGVYDTEYSDQPLIKHMFSAPGLYNTTVEVADPKGLTAKLMKSALVSTSNPNLVPRFTYTPENPNTSDLVLLDASSSYDPDNAGNTFLYRWDFEDDDTFDTEYLSNPVVSHTFNTEGNNTVVLEIKDQWGLVNQASIVVYIAHSNRKPTAAFFSGCEYGNLTTNFYFNASQTSDNEDWADLMKVRWDFDSDGNWDTEYNKIKTAYHLYGTPGTFKVRMQVLDSGGLTDTTSLNVYVSSGTNETGLILDETKGIYYGTVKIGTQWWMSENLNETSSGKFCYSGRNSNCETYGGLYTWTAVMNGTTSEKAQGLCPSGWHIPSLTEWTKLIDFYGETLAKGHLEVGGDSDFRMLLAGQRSTGGSSEMMNQVTNFWTSTKSSGENSFAISFQKDQANYFKLNLSRSYGFSVRCVKE
ncbi:MAG: FISUMP domain-containing protein [Bacteroidales bacterium]|nr:FISUMP domain-containing protein [Bacteroidales bacterium]